MTVSGVDVGSSEAAAPTTPVTRRRRRVPSPGRMLFFLIFLGLPLAVYLEGVQYSWQNTAGHTRSPRSSKAASLGSRGWLGLCRKMTVRELALPQLCFSARRILTAAAASQETAKFLKIHKNTQSGTR